jgi:hypothetical protein
MRVRASLVVAAVIAIGTSSVLVDGANAVGATSVGRILTSDFVFAAAGCAPSVLET